MKIHLIGNVINLAVIFGMSLHESGYKVRVFFDKRAPELYMPHWEYPQFKNELPEWAEIIDVDMKRLFIGGKKERAFIRSLKDCDIIQAFGESAVWARFTGRPYVFLSYGGDLDILPFNRSSIKGFLYSYILKDALRKAELALYTMPQQGESVKRLGLANGRFFPCAIPIDTNRYKPSSREEKERLRSGYKADLIFFQPSRQEWTCRDTNHKGNDKLFRAFARFVKNRVGRAVLVAVEKGRDVRKSKDLVEQLGIRDSVRWIAPLNKPGLIQMLNTADLCFDDFTYGYYGFSTLEAFSTGTPTFLYLDRKLSGIELPPVVNVRTEEEILQKMEELSADSKERERIGIESREWVLRHHALQKVIPRYINLYKEILRKVAR